MHTACSKYKKNMPLQQPIRGAQREKMVAGFALNVSEIYELVQEV